MNQSEHTPDDPQPPDAPPHLSARVPPSVSRGVFCSGMVVMTGAHEFVLDFIQNLGQPPQVAARVIIPHAVMPQFVHALRTNLELHQRNFDPLPVSAPPAEKPNKPSVQQLYDELKLADDTLSGVYANGVLIVHSATEFKFDFLTNLVPHPAVSARIYLSAPQAARVLDSLAETYRQFQQKQQPDEDP